MEAKEIVKWQDETALDRFKLISPLIDPALDPAKRAKLRQEIADNNGISERSLFRYEKAYREGNFTGLKPASRAVEPGEGPFPGFRNVLDEAILLKREVPTRSVNQIILILEGEGKYLVRYSTPSVAVIELPNVYTICVTKEKVFIIPKRCVPAEVKDEVERRMKEGLGDRYTVKEK